MVLLLTMNCVLDNSKMFTDKSFTSLPVKFTNIFCRKIFCSTVHTQGLLRHFAQEHSQEGRERVRQSREVRMWLTNVIQVYQVGICAHKSSLEGQTYIRTGECPESVNHHDTMTKIT